MTKKWWLLLVLMLSIGLNVGFLAGRVAGPKVVAADAEKQAPEDLPKATDSGAPALPRIHRISNRMADELRLEGERRRAFIDMQKDFFRSSAQGKRRLMTARRELRAQLISDQPDRAAAEHWVAELGAAQADLERIFIDNYFETRELVEPEQYPKLKRLMGRIHKTRRQLMEKAARGQALRERRNRLRPNAD